MVNLSEYRSLVLNCKHPVSVYNKYLHRTLYVPCGHCSECLLSGSASDTMLINNQFSLSAYALFCTFTFDDAHLPLATVTQIASSECEAILKSEVRKFRHFDATKYVMVNVVSDPRYDVPWSNTGYVSKYDLSHFFTEIGTSFQSDDCFRISYMPHSIFPAFWKRCKTRLARRMDNRYEKIQVYMVSEYGSRTHRAHLHVLFFTDSKEVADVLPKVLRSTWIYGSMDCRPATTGGVSSYVASYLTQCIGLPPLYQLCRYLRPYSRRSPYFGIGAGEILSGDHEIPSGTPVGSYDRFDPEDRRPVSGVEDHATRTLQRVVRDYGKVDMLSLSESLHRRCEILRYIYSYGHGSLMGNVFEFVKDIYRYERDESCKGRSFGRVYSLYSRDEPERYKDKVQLVAPIDDSQGLRQVCDDPDNVLVRHRFRYCYTLFRKLRFLLSSLGERLDFSYSAIFSIYRFARRCVSAFNNRYYSMMDRCISFAVSSGLRLEDIVSSIFIKDANVPLLDNFNVDKKARSEYFRLRKLHLSHRILAIA